MKLIRTRKYKTNMNHPTGLAICDFCGFHVNGGNLRKYTNYAGAPFPNYSIPNRYMEPTGDLMSSGDIIWDGFMVCSKCLDKPNGQSSWREPTADPFTADGNRPAPDFALDAVYTVLATQSNQPLGTESGLSLGFTT